MHCSTFSMWANVWYFLGSQLITLAVAFVMSLCFESPFIRLEKLWIGALLQAIMPSKNDHVKKNGRVAEQQTSKILDEIIDRFDKEEEEKRQQMDHSQVNDIAPKDFMTGEKEQIKDDIDKEERMFMKEEEKENGHPHVMDESEGTINFDNVELNLSTTEGCEIAGNALTVAEVHIGDKSLPIYEDIVEK
jgi:hypothetical protein